MVNAVAIGEEIRDPIALWFPPTRDGMSWSVQTVWIVTPGRLRALSASLWHNTALPKANPYSLAPLTALVK
jgi:hypothetical protein